MQNSNVITSGDSVRLRFLNVAEFEASGQNGQLMTLAAIVCLLIVAIAIAKSL
ncbi:hypothetical protein [Spirosoma foliorum]|uniref:Uncharacterized protein n=1 Tax=Spirosoma foliorum TaxID=2710596 RepID=A0A7G5H2S9_9BACT|nr:hypothetical protein [Spirosoma foliorum]QMW05421.1 hypothetical protein H3H32_11265 [Spirosoma foliorum]